MEIYFKRLTQCCTWKSPGQLQPGGLHIYGVTQDFQDWLKQLSSSMVMSLFSQYILLFGKSLVMLFYYKAISACERWKIQGNTERCKKNIKVNNRDFLVVSSWTLCSQCSGLCHSWSENWSLTWLGTTYISHSAGQIKNRCFFLKKKLPIIL